MGLSNNGVFLFFMLLLLICHPYVQSSYTHPSCTFGSCDAWVSFDGINWHNTTYEKDMMNRGQPFYVKTRISTFQPDVLISIRFFEPGVNTAYEASFEILSGEVMGVIDQSVNQSYRFHPSKNPMVCEQIWKVKIRDEAVWWNGSTALNIIAQFNQNTSGREINEHVEVIRFTILHTLIQKPVYQGPDLAEISDDADADPVISSSFFLLCLTVFCSCLCFVVLKKH